MQVAECGKAECTLKTDLPGCSLWVLWVFSWRIAVGPRSFLFLTNYSAVGTVPHTSQHCNGYSPSQSPSKNYLPARPWLRPLFPYSLSAFRLRGFLVRSSLVSSGYSCLLSRGLAFPAPATERNSALRRWAAGFFPVWASLCFCCGSSSAIVPAVVSGGHGIFVLSAWRYVGCLLVFLVHVSVHSLCPQPAHCRCVALPPRSACSAFLLSIVCARC